MADLDDLGRTALGVTWARAAESSRDDALFRDPLAEAIAPVLRQTGGIVLEAGAGTGLLAADVLRRLGVDQMQGYLFGRPASIEAATAHPVTTGSGSIAA